MKHYKVYLAGSITGLTYDSGQDWRVYSTAKLEELGITGYSPLRNKEYLRKIDIIPPISDTKKVLSTHKGIISRDHYDVVSSDALLINLYDAPRVSIGTCFEIAWAYEHRIPMVLVVPEGEHHHKHGFIEESVPFIVHDLEEAIDVIGKILLP